MAQARTLHAAPRRAPTLAELRQPARALPVSAKGAWYTTSALQSAESCRKESSMKGLGGRTLAPAWVLAASTYRRLPCRLPCAESGSASLRSCALWCSARWTTYPFFRPFSCLSASRPRQRHYGLLRPSAHIAAAVWGAQWLCCALATASYPAARSSSQSCRTSKTSSPRLCPPLA